MGIAVEGTYHKLKWLFACRKANAAFGKRLLEYTAYVVSTTYILTGISE